MAKFTWKASHASMQVWHREFDARIKAKVAAILREAGEITRDVTSSVIKAAPRWETGAYSTNVGVDFKGSNAASMQVRVGWLDDEPDWWIYQELGTKQVEALYALADGFAAGEAYTKAQLRSVLY